ncbi:MAG: heparinase II/III family protein [Verrucomicrobia bacterium]|nr:heparinase II/III family protein [Verrucomicrobiota bacterium]
MCPTVALTTGCEANRPIFLMWCFSLSRRQPSGRRCGWSGRRGAPFLLVVAWLVLGGSLAQAARTYGGYYTEERLAHARKNGAELDWARQRRDEAVKQAAPLVARSDEALWALVPGQALGRCIDVTLDRSAKGAEQSGCLVCGDKISAHGNYPYQPDCEQETWKLTCPSCKSVFPTNDFGRFYRSGLDEHGVFDPAKADRTLLFNTEHPDPADPLHKFGVDDGLGYIDAKGRAHRFIGYYAWKHWTWLYDGTRALAEAFVLTGDRGYAHKAAVLLDRIADLYPSLDWKPYGDLGWYHSDGGRRRGKIEGAIWETFVVTKLAEAYDAILSGTVGDAALDAFLAGQARRYRLPGRKGTRDLFVENVDTGLLRCAYHAVLAGQIAGNEGMHQLTVATCALALNTAPETTRWLDWLFAPKGGAIPGLLLERFDRDGLSDEGAPSYAALWGRSFADVALRIGDYPGYERRDAFTKFPAFRSIFDATLRMAVLDRAVPNLGDSGVTGSVSAAPMTAEFIALGYRLTRDPGLAGAAWRANGSTAKGLGRDIFAADPEALGREIERVAATAASRTRPPGGELMTGFGLALLESGQGPDGVGLAVNYGRTLNHAHLDQLNFDLFAHGHWLAPDHGYPEFATSWPQRDAWTINTLSHNTVFVDGAAQGRNWGGKVRLHARMPGLAVVQLEAKSAYPQVQDYTRTLLLIDAPAGASGGAYVVDLFHVQGGRDHVYSFHGPPGEVATTGVELVAQASGTYAGAKVPFAAPAGKFPLGYSYLYNVKKAQRPAGPVTIDWKMSAGRRGLQPSDGVHLRLHVLAPCDDLALAQGDPPQNKPGNPRRLDYVLLHRAGPELESTFISVLEPYRDRPTVKSVSRLAAEGARAVALRVELADGTVDRILFNPSGDAPLKVDGGVSLTGELGYVRESAGKPATATLVHGRELTHPSGRLTSAGEITGRVVAMNRELAGGGWLIVDAVLPTDGSLVGQPILIASGGERDACYLIRGVSRDGGGSKIDCGPITFAQGYRGPKAFLRGARLPTDYTQGYVYDFEPGDRFKIPLLSRWTEGGGEGRR